MERGLENSEAVKGAGEEKEERGRDQTEFEGRGRGRVCEFGEEERSWSR